MQQGRDQQVRADGYVLVPPPYPGDGKVHACVPGRAIARCGLPGSSDPAVCQLVRGEFLGLYPESDQCTSRPDGSDGCAQMVAANDPGPAVWPE